MSITRDEVLATLRRLAASGHPAVTSTQVIQASGGRSATVRRHLDALCAQGGVLRDGKARATRYRLREPASAYDEGAGLGVAEPGPASAAAAAARGRPAWSPAAVQLRAWLDLPLGARDPVSYRREWVDRYLPNQTTLLPPTLADELYSAGRLREQQPAGTYARKVLEQLLIDLSWSSSRLEGNTYSLLATQELFRRGSAGTDADAVMLLNHKAAIEFMVDAVPVQGLTEAVVRNVHALLMQDLLPDSQGLGAIRQKVVNISGTVYVPTQVPALLQEMLGLVIERARQVKNPIEAAFFLWLHLAYLQPFEDGNKRTSRLAANMPLMLYNCAPLSFIDVEVGDYAQAMLGMYERGDVSLAADLFAWAYRRSLGQYAAVRESLGAPDPLRLRYRESLTLVIQQVVQHQHSAAQAMQALGLDELSAPGFARLLDAELEQLQVFNCARYRLGLQATQAWIAAGRPR